MNITPEQLLMKIGLLVMENDALRVELGKLQQEKVQAEGEIVNLKKDWPAWKR